MNAKINLHNGPEDARILNIMLFILDYSIFRLEVLVQLYIQLSLCKLICLISISPVLFFGTMIIQLQCVYLPIFVYLCVHVFTHITVCAGGGYTQKEWIEITVIKTTVIFSERQTYLHSFENPEFWNSEGGRIKYPLLLLFSL